MKNGFALALQKAIREHLVNDLELSKLVGNRVYDEPPIDVIFPYVRFNTISPKTFDTDTREGAIVEVSLDVYSRQGMGARTEATTIAEMIRSALHRKETTIPIQDHSLIEMICEGSYSHRGGNGNEAVAVISFQAMLEQT